ncbi:MAG TPA: MBL fold metallo-hydrolase, partial [Candidatus Limnocylindrales bacterium]|nr:MBL fold metallo-hydrolase [Candidatus Limnocylindrales bacterium]
TFMPRRFATWFFAADLPVGAEPSIVGDEIAAHRWLAPGAALDLLATGAIEMWVPTTSVLERLVEIGATTATAVSEAVTIGRLDPPQVIHDRPDTVRIACFGAGGLPGRPCTTSILGRRDVVVVDPGDPSEAAVALIASLIEERGATLRAVVLTATDPDHAAAAEAFAIPAECPILVAPGAGRRLPYATVQIDEAATLPADIHLQVRLGSPGSGRLDLVPGLSAEATRPGSG